jgi:hypothetical protein
MLNGMMQDARSLIIGAIILMAMAFVVMTWSRTKALVPTLGALLLGAIVVAGVSSYGTLRSEVNDDITSYTKTQNKPLDETVKGGGG